MPDPPVPRYLLIIRRDRPDLYARLHPITEGYVTFLRDRRRGERRAKGVPVTPERRVADRRSDPPTTWTVLGFVLHRAEEPSS